MHHISYNELRLDFSLIPVSPLCIQVHDTTRFVRTTHPAGGMSLYIPGGTLKGALRRAAEHILMSAGRDCCDPQNPCAEREIVKRATTTPDLYRALCVACRLFGSPVLRSHITVTDFFPAEPVNRATIRGDVEVVADETFYGTVSLKNFERWHVGLLALMLSRVNIADVQIGARRSEGMGCVVMRYTNFTVIYPDLVSSAMEPRLYGIGHLIGTDNRYGYTTPDVSDLPASAVYDRGLGYAAFMVTEPDADDAHTLIDNIMTPQALAWSIYLRGSK